LFLVIVATSMRKILSYCVLFIASGWSAEGAEICLRNEAVCAGPVVRLSDVADLGDAGEELASLPLFPVPAAGKPRVAKRQEIEQLLRFSDVPLADCKLTGAESVVIHGGQKSVTKTLRRPAYQIVPASANIIRETGRPTQPAAAAAPAIPTAIAAKAETPEKLVARGQNITVRAVAPGVRITSSGKALADGALGDDVTVELADNRLQVQGRVAGAQLVEIRTAAGK
jgi:flagella basal body P-ring formation protein FlgA